MKSQSRPCARGLPWLTATAFSAVLGACGAEPAPGGAAAAGAANGSAGAAGGSLASGGSVAGGVDSAGGQGGRATSAQAGSGGAAAGEQGHGGSAGSGGGAVSSGKLSASPAEGLWTGVRYYPNGTGNTRTSGPQGGPEKTFTLHNSDAQALDVTLALSGSDAAKLTIIAPPGGAASIPAGSDLSVTLRLTTETAVLGQLPAQDDGATVLHADLTVNGGGSVLTLRQYALVLTYVEYEPTFGQILKGFPGYTSKLPSWLPDDANPNPGTPLPGVVADTDEVSAPAFERLDPNQPVTLRPLARFSPPGAMPFGWYAPGNVAARTTVAAMAEEQDPHTNDKSRLLEPPLASGSTSFEPSRAKFGIWMMPAGVGLLTSVDADGFDGQHRVRSWTLRDDAGAVIPGSFLLGGEEAANGDYQDYVFIVTNVKPAP